MQSLANNQTEHSRSTWKFATTSYMGQHASELSIPTLEVQLPHGYWESTDLVAKRSPTRIKA